MFDGQTWWIIGASEGLGAALAQTLDDHGATLILSARNADKLTDVASGCKSARPLPMDVTDANSVATAVDLAGPVDGVIYCVGLYEPMPATSWRPDTAEQMTDANYTGALRVLSWLVPEMTARRSGRIMLIGSLAGHRGLPGAIGYGASKAALMHLAENMRVDLKGTGVRVQLANPGFIRTRLTDKNGFAMPQIMSPDTAARHVVKLLASRRFSSNFPAPFAWVFTVGRHLPLRLFQWIVK
ncbi:SDR family NAD(P)-dependent oxidoreductase [Phaeobacter marinintestinus]|uniref:SDR family NAD(P)-dependent oxidoreductase n=1 Tax=Falsiphaeobacter marinintestinus TaxID=1492905 RepID=UPI0011B40977|nr:SDR family NAD(P)-dependent oxidoreductase [Phaeobacter marinintestinus]